MPCIPTTLPGGQRAIVCTSRGSRPRCVACGRPAGQLCDWKVGDGTCDKPICASCSVRPAPEKDLCPEHAKAWAAWKAERSRSKSAGPALGS